MKKYDLCQGLKHFISVIEEDKWSYDERRKLFDMLHARAKNCITGFVKYPFGTFCPPLKDVLIFGVKIGVVLSTRNSGHVLTHSH